MSGLSGNGWIEGSSLMFFMDAVMIGSTTFLEESPYDLYTFTVPETAPTPPPIDSQALEVSIVRTTGDYGEEESFILYEENTGKPVFIQPRVKPYLVYTWNVFLTPGMYVVEMIDSYGDGWSDGSKVDFVFNSTTIATTTLDQSPYSYVYVNISDTSVIAIPTCTVYICNEVMYPSINDIPADATKLIFSQSSYSSINSLDLSRFTQLEELVFEGNTFVNCDSLFINNPQLQSIKIGDNSFERSDSGSRRLSGSIAVMSILNGDNLDSLTVGAYSMGNLNKIVLEGCVNDVEVHIRRSSFSNVDEQSIEYDDDSHSLVSNLKTAIERANPKTVEANNWAILVCGSTGYYNYRHHADVAHAYQIMREGGIPPDHIITLMYNDVPNSPDNPFPGKLFNRPGNDSPDVYEGVIVDYKGSTVSPTTLMKVLLGDSTTRNKVLNSTHNDNVFLYFADHGAPGALSLPSDNLYVDELINVIRAMHEKDVYNKFVLYVDACYSGSMFTRLPDDLNVVAVTASNEQSPHMQFTVVMKLLLMEPILVHVWVMSFLLLGWRVLIWVIGILQHLIIISSILDKRLLDLMFLVMAMYLSRMI